MDRGVQLVVSRSIRQFQVGIAGRRKPQARSSNARRPKRVCSKAWRPVAAQEGPSRTGALLKDDRAEYKAELVRLRHGRVQAMLRQEEVGATVWLSAEPMDAKTCDFCY